MLRVVGLLAICFLLIAGCTEPPEIELHEPGEYKGKTDPLLNQSGTAEQEERLRERLLMVQTDR
jgi:hypothetical protein